MTQPLRIAQVVPPMERVPPRAYGGTERIVYELVNELDRRGHAGDDVRQRRLRRARHGSSRPSRRRSGRPATTATPPHGST